MTPGYRLLQDNYTFTTFGYQHIVMFLVIILLSALLPILIKRQMSPKGRILFSRVMSMLIAGTVVVWTILRVWLGQFDIKTDLPFDICNMTAILLPFLMWNPSKRVHEVLYFLILAGTLQAVLTPDLAHEFPHFTFIKYWMVHGGLVVCAVFYTIVFDLFPDGKSIIRAFIWLQVYTGFAFLINLLLDANYFYVMHKPQTTSLMDFFGPWPWYLLVCEGVAFVLFLIVYFPVYFTHRSTVQSNS